MKTIIIIIYIFSINFIYSQYDPSLLTKPIQLNDQKQLVVAMSSLMQIYGDAFIYYDKINMGYYEYKIDKKGDYYLYIYNNDNKNLAPLEKIGLTRVTDMNGVNSMTIDKGTLDRVIDKQKFISKGNKLNSYGLDTKIINTDGILIDREILKFDEKNDYGKILSRDFCLRYLKYKDTKDPSPLFEYCVDGAIIPYSTGDKSKMLMLDKGWGAVMYAEKNELFNGINTYGGYGFGENELAYPSGIAVGRSYTSGSDIIYPIYICDQNNHRLVKIKFVIDESGESQFDETSFTVIDSTLGGITDACYFRSNTVSSNNDKIWVSGSRNNIPSLVCFDTSGNVIQTVIGYKNPNGGEDILFGNITDIRLTCYNEGFNSLVFTDIARNNVVLCQLDTLGKSALNSLGGSNYDIVAEPLLDFPTGYYINSVKYQKTSPGTAQWGYLWVTTGFSSLFGDNGSMIHLFKVNDYSHWQYLGSTDKPRNSDYSFSQLLNTALTGGYYDIFTIEGWGTQTYGLRRYVPFVDITNDGVSNYCGTDSMDNLQWHATFTNECWVKISAERKTAIGWESVDLKSIDYTTYSPGTKNATIFRYAGWTEDHPIKIKLDLPLKDYIFGDSVKLHATLYPEYLDTLVGSQSIDKDYTVFVQKTCLPAAGGCPFLYVTDPNRNYTADNNLLDKSEYSSGDITDKYKLLVPPKTSGDSIELSILENESDNGSINMVKLYAIDYPSNRKLGITDANVLVLYDSSMVVSSDTVLKNNTNITSHLNFNVPDTILTSGVRTDSLYTHFTYASLLSKLKKNIPNKATKNTHESKKQTTEEKAISESITLGPGAPPPNWAFIGDIGNLIIPNSYPKDTGGVVTASSIYSNTVSKMFARREKNSLVVLPLFGDSNKVSNFKIKWQDDYRIKYVGIANLEYSGYNINEISMKKAYYVTSTLDSDITSSLSAVDTSYGLISPSGLIKMEFDLSGVASIPSHWIRSYVIEVNGHYTTTTDNPLLSNSKGQLPLVYKLSQNYPNPFNPSTKISYEIPKTSKVKLIIYDILGREVKRLVDNEIINGGQHTVDFDGTNLASGVYFYHIEAGLFNETKKMVLLK